MSSSHKNLNEFKVSSKIDVTNCRFAIVVSDWNESITNALYSGAVQELVDRKVPKEQISKHEVPGSFELTIGAQWLAERPEIDAVICLGCVIQGETKHFDFICHAVSDGITNVSLKYNKPVIFGVLTPDTFQQALDRAGGKHGNKGKEAAHTAMKMLQLKKSLA